MANTIHKYKKEFTYSYISGAYAAIELITCCPKTGMEYHYSYKDPSTRHYPEKKNGYTLP